MLDIGAPELLSEQHDTSTFVSGESILDRWLQKKALQNQNKGASRCFVVCIGKQVIGYYGLSAGAIAHGEVRKSMRRNMPNPLPILLLGRLAIDQKYHNQGLGSALLQDAMLRSIAIAAQTGVFAILVHALSEQAKRFYLSRGFVVSPVQPMTLMMTMTTVRETIV